MKKSLENNPPLKEIPECYINKENIDLEEQEAIESIIKASIILKKFGYKITLTKPSR